MAKTETRCIDGWPERAKELMSRQGLTYDDLAAPLGVTSRGSVSHYFVGRRSLSAQQAVAIADRLGCSLEWMLTGEVRSTGSEGKANLTPEEAAEVLRKLQPDVYAAIVHLLKHLQPQPAKPRSRER